MRGIKVVALGALVVFVVLVAALQGDAATTLVVGVLAAVALVAWWRRSPSAAGSVLSLAVTLLGTSMTTAWAGDQTPLVSPLQAGLVFWLFAFVVAVVVWLVPQPDLHNRALTTAMAHAVLLAASPFVVLAPSAAPIAGLCAAMAVVAWRCRGSVRTQPSTSAPHTQRHVGRAAELRGAGRTAEVLAAACSSGWQVLGSRVLPDNGAGPRPVEQVLVGPPGVYVVETRSWQGDVALVDAPGDEAGVQVATQAYALDGDTTELAARLAPVARNVRQLADLLGIDPVHAYGLVVFWDGTFLPEGAVELTVLAENSHAELVLLNGDQLDHWLRQQPMRMRKRNLTRLANDVETNLPPVP
ncbi:nuclease-related domain-containing protein [Actinopolymorpha sp. B9G3]|uniref:nuclease-related domain-containing protein n=1 Tax=Actinopolymorpha sp. B9G3 TaxID=3158970 RepID=UPI0032D8CD08